MSAIIRATRDDHDALVALQRAAYAQNRAILGVEPLPLLADYARILSQDEVWLVGDRAAPDGALILQWRPDDVLIWSVSTHPRARSRGLGDALLALAEGRAHDEGRRVLRLYTGEALTANVAWYGRRGFVVERVEQTPDRRIVHMVKTITGDDA